MVRAKLMIHRNEVETLHLIGASDEYIAQQFRRHTLRGTLRGALAGVLATLTVLIAAATLSQSLSTGIFPPLRLIGLQLQELADIFARPAAAQRLQVAAQHDEHGDHDH